MQICRFDCRTIFRHSEGEQTHGRAKQLACSSNLQFCAGTSRWLSLRFSNGGHHCHFLFEIFWFVFANSLWEKKNTNRAAGLLNQGRRAVAGLKKRQPHSVGVLPLMFCDIFDPFGAVVGY
jgi:hypothetical protein